MPCAVMIRALSFTLRTAISVQKLRTTSSGKAGPMQVLRTILLAVVVLMTGLALDSHGHGGAPLHETGATTSAIETDHREPWALRVGEADGGLTVQRRRAPTRAHAAESRINACVAPDGEPVTAATSGGAAVAQNPCYRRAHAVLRTRNPRDPPRDLG